jgi:hypothetical protein
MMNERSPGVPGVPCSGAAAAHSAGVRAGSACRKSEAPHQKRAQSHITACGQRVWRIAQADMRYGQCQGCRQAMAVVRERARHRLHASQGPIAAALPGAHHERGGAQGGGASARTPPGPWWCRDGGQTVRCGMRARACKRLSGAPAAAVADSAAAVVAVRAPVSTALSREQRQQKETSVRRRAAASAQRAARASPVAPAACRVCVQRSARRAAACGAGRCNAPNAAAASRSARRGPHGASNGTHLGC